MLCYLYILHVYTCMYQYMLGAHGSIVPGRDLVLIYICNLCFCQSTAIGNIMNHGVDLLRGFGPKFLSTMMAIFIFLDSFK